MKSILFLAQVGAIESEGKKISCPAISCDTTIGDFVCYEHSSSTPVEYINTYLCPFDQVCNLEGSKFAWVTAKYQYDHYVNTDKQKSQIYNKFTDKNCELTENFTQDLENGRFCQKDRMCKTGICKEKELMCQGAVDDETCIDHY